MRVFGVAALVLAAGAAAAWGAPSEPSLTPAFDALPRGRRAPKPEPWARAPAEIPAEPAPQAEGIENPALPPRRLRLKPEKLTRRPFAILRTRAWLAGGSADTRFGVQVPPAQITPPAVVYTGQTQERGASGVMIVSSLELAPFEFLSFEVQYGRDKARGHYDEKYWIHAPDAYRLIYFPTGATWHNPNHEDDLVYGADVAARREWAVATAYLRLVDAKINAPEGLDLRHTFDFAVGVERLRQNADLTNLAITANSKKYYSNADPGPIPGFASTYDALWQAPHFGIREEVTALTGFSLQGLFFYSPAADYHGRGFDNFAAEPGGGGRAESPNFADWAHGSMYHFEVDMGWAWPNFRVEAGYQQVNFFARKGLRRYYLSDGTTADRVLDYAQAELGGFFAGASLRF